MDWGLVTSNLLNPPILFFFLGMLAVLLRSDLEISQPIPKFLSLYLLMAIGFHGGVELHHSELNRRVLVSLLAAMAMASLVPAYTFFILKQKLTLPDAAAVAATYGSISAVTFITASSFLHRIGVEYGGWLVAAMALMESPAIVIGVTLFRFFSKDENGGDFSWADLFRDTFLNGSVFLILGSLLIGIITGDQGWNALKPFADDIFKGMLTFFLLDMGLIAARRIRDLKKTGVFLTAFGVLIPLLNAGLGMLLAKLIGMSKGGALMFTVLSASIYCGSGGDAPGDSRSESESVRADGAGDHLSI